MGKNLDFESLEAVYACVEAEPESAASLVFYGLVKGMAPELEGRGNPLALSRLRMLDADQRQLAYGLMELYAQGANQQDEWRERVACMDRIVAGED